MSMARRFVLFFFAWGLTFANGSALLAAPEETGYDLFTSEMAYTPGHSTSKKVAAEFLTYPFEIVRWPLNKTLIVLEEERIPAKTHFIYERLVDNGFKPVIGFSAQGAEVDFTKLTQLEDKLPPSLVSRGWLMYGHDRIFETGTQLGYEAPDENGFHAFGNFSYDRRPDEDFYGLGPDSNEDRETGYKMERSTVEAIAGYTHESTIKIDFRGAYSNVDIENDEDEGSGILNETFEDRAVTGLGGDKIVTAGTSFTWAPLPDIHLVSPGKLRLAVDFNEGVHDSRARYFKFLADINKNFQLGSPGRVLALRFYGEHNNHFRNHETPFYNMARLGGFGTHPFLSQTLRSFENNRFIDENALLFNFEYRYRVYENRDFTLTHVLFIDEGQVFKSFGRFKVGDFRESYGTGFRLGYLDHLLLDMEMAFGEEGAAFHVKTRQPF